MKLSELKRNEDVVIQIQTQEEYERVMQVLEELGYKWNGGELPTELNCWIIETRNFCIRIKSAVIGFFNVDYYISEGYAIHQISDFEELKQKPLKQTRNETEKSNYFGLVRKKR